MEISSRLREGEWLVPPKAWCFGAPGSSPSSLRVCSSCLGPAALRRLAEACGDGKEPSHRRVPGLEAGQVQEALSEGSGLEVLGCFGSCQGLCLLPEAAGLSHGTNCSLWEETSSPSVAPEPGSPKTGATGASCESFCKAYQIPPDLCTGCCRVYIQSLFQGATQKSLRQVFQDGLYKRGGAVGGSAKQGLKSMPPTPKLLQADLLRFSRASEHDPSTRGFCPVEGSCGRATQAMYRSPRGLHKQGRSEQV